MNQVAGAGLDYRLGQSADVPGVEGAQQLSFTCRQGNDLPSSPVQRNTKYPEIGSENGGNNVQMHSVPKDVHTSVAILRPSYNIST